MHRVQPIPEGFHSVTPYLSIRGAAQAIDFYKRAFGAVERYRLPGPDGQSIGHAELTIGNSIVMLADEMPQSGTTSPQSIKGTTVNFVIYVEDADEVYEQAIEAGAKVVREIADQFYGERAGCIEDPFGHHWTVMTHIEDVPPEEMASRMAAEYEKMAQQK